MKVKYIGNTLLRTKNGVIRFGDIIEVDRTINCVEHFFLWYNKTTITPIIQTPGLVKAMKELLPIVVYDQNRFIEKSYYKIVS